MFPPTTPTTERIRIENEKREFELRLARESQMTPIPSRFQFRWSLLGHLGRLTSTFAAIRHNDRRKPQSEPPISFPE